MLRNGSICSSSSATAEEKVETLLSSGQIPIIDLAHSGTDQRPSRAVVNRVAIQLQKAISEKGVAFLVNHGICDEKLQSAWSYLDKFCDLPTDTKEVYIRKGNDNHGYIKPGQERFDGNEMAAEIRHAFNICTLNASNLPEEPLPGFSEHVAELAGEFKALSTLILQALAIGLGLDMSYFVDNHSHMLSGEHENETTLRLLYYPPIVEDDNKCELTKGRCKYSYQRCAMDRPDLGPKDESPSIGDDETTTTTTLTRCGAHCDYGTFTLLSQDSEGGLEVKLPGSGRWKRVGHLPGAILLNTGEILAMWTADRYPALNHRVIVPEQESVRSRGRHSMAYFCHPDNATVIEPLPEAVCEESKDKTTRKNSFKVAKSKVTSAYHLIQQKFRQTYGHQNNGNSGESS